MKIVNPTRIVALGLPLAAIGCGTVVPASPLPDTTPIVAWYTPDLKVFTTQRGFSKEAFPFDRRLIEEVKAYLFGNASASAAVQCDSGGNLYIFGNQKFVKVQPEGEKVFRIATKKQLPRDLSVLALTAHLSPSGTLLAIFSTSSKNSLGRADLHVLNLADNTTRLVKANLELPVYGGLSWSHDESSLYFLDSGASSPDPTENSVTRRYDMKSKRIEQSIVGSLLATSQDGNSVMTINAYPGKDIELRNIVRKFGEGKELFSVSTDKAPAQILGFWEDGTFLGVDFSEQPIGFRIEKGNLGNENVQEVAIVRYEGDQPLIFTAGRLSKDTN